MAPERESIITKLRALRARFDVAHAEGMAALKRKDFAGVDAAIRVEAKIIREQEALVVEQRAALQELDERRLFDLTKGRTQNRPAACPPADSRHMPAKGRCAAVSPMIARPLWTVHCHGREATAVIHDNARTRELRISIGGRRAFRQVIVDDASVEQVSAELLSRFIAAGWVPE